MDNIWLLLLAISIFIGINILLYGFLKAYVEKTLGKKWLTFWGNKVYFWQSSIFVSTAGTFVILYLLKWSQVISF